MIFTSYTYVLFLAVAFVVYGLAPVRWRNGILVIASFVFYCSWRWQYGFLLLAVTLFNWAWGRWALRPADGGGWRLALGIAANVGALAYFKYLGFLVASAAAVARAFGAGWHAPAIAVLLPLGISFFTFQGIAYLVDVAAGDEPMRGLGDFLLFKTFWPKLIAGPIVRLSEMREEIADARPLSYDNVSAGAERILFGFFKKVVLADNLAPYVATVFDSAVPPHALDALIGILGFGLQIYFDFSAYSDIAIGTGRLFGFRFPENFNWPYAATSPRGFWNRWHMTLTRWIRDYVFTPLEFAWRRSRVPAGLPIVLAMALCGLWHGARWTFVVWGVWHGCLLLSGRGRGGRFAGERDPAGAPRWRRVTGWAATFASVQVGWLLFRSPSFTRAWELLEALLTLRGGLQPALVRENVVLLVAVLTLGLWALQLLRQPVARFCVAWPRWPAWAAVLRPLAYAAIIVAVVILDREAQAFVYFQF